MASPLRLAPGLQLAGKYRLRRLLASGGMGQVWVATNESTGADVALKVLRRAEAGEGDVEGVRHAEERLRQEARLSAMLTHRSIVRVFDLVEQDGSLVLVMELLRGETLHDYAKRLGPRSSEEAIAILVPVLGALAHAHDLGLVHRDVTPSNIFLGVDPDGHVTPKLVDFGIAKARAGVIASRVETVAGDVLGTPRYVAPERIRALPDLDGRADLFSVGVVLYELLTGVSPFAATTASASLAAVLERPVDPDPSIDPRVWLELRRAVAKQPYERHASARELAVGLRDAIGATDASLEAQLQLVAPLVAPLGAPDGVENAAPLDEPPTVAPWQTPEPSPTPGRRRGSWVVAAALVAIVGGGTVALARGSRAVTPVASAAPAAPAAPAASAAPAAPAASLGSASAPLAPAASLGSASAPVAAPPTAPSPGEGLALPSPAAPPSAVAPQ